MNPDKTIAALDAAIALFGDKGFDNTSTQSIAKQAGIGTGTLFKYFDSKEALIRKAYLHAKLGMIKACKRDVDPTASFPIFLSRVWRNVLDWCLENSAKHKFILQIKRSRFDDPEVTAEIEKELLFFLVALQAAQDKGELIDAPMDVINATLFSFLNLTIDFINLDPSQSKQHERIFYQLLLNSLKINSDD